MSSRLLVVKVFCYGVICFLCQVTLSDCEITLVTRNVTDTFRIGQDGCLKNTSVCNEYQASCQNDGSCLCNKNTPHFRNPVILHSGGSYGSSYGCIDKVTISYRVDKIACEFRPYQVIANDHKEPAAEFINKPKAISCTFKSLEAKFPNNNSQMNINWLNKDYLQINISTSTLYFKWRSNISKLEGSIITISMTCKVSQSQYSTECLQAKVLGTWRSFGNKDDVTHSPTTMFPSDIFSVSRTHSAPTNSAPTNSAPTNTMYSSSTTSSNAKQSSSKGIPGSTIIAVAVAVPLIVLIIILVVVLLIKQRIFKRSVSKRNYGIGHVNTGITYQNKKTQNTPGNSEYAKPSIERVMVNGDMYAVANKKKPKGKDTQDGKSPNVLLSSEYAEPEIESVMDSGDMYAVANKNKTSEKQKQELNYMDPENLGLANNASADLEKPSQPTEYASIVGVMQNN